MTVTFRGLFMHLIALVLSYFNYFLPKTSSSANFLCLCRAFDSKRGQKKNALKYTHSGFKTTKPGRVIHQQSKIPKHLSL